MFTGKKNAQAESWESCFIRDITEDNNLGNILSDSSEELIQRVKGGAWYTVISAGKIKQKKTTQRNVVEHQKITANLEIRHRK